MALARPLRLLLAVALLLWASLGAAPAAADVGETIIQRCTHGQSLAGFSPSAYSKALRELSADAEEYTNCSTLIRAAQLAAASGHGTGAVAGAVAPIAATPSEQRALKTAARSGGKPLQIGGQVVRPGVVHATVASALSSLPTPVLAVLALLLAGLAALGGGTLRRRIRGHHPD
jgi:hypothetical protein